ncbi:MAG: hypothetical protein LBK76_08745 [Verrucomicrobiales bacterium]|jgi:hypothetical protein|nr:hypothetical protein [Verrucomicrobiales bacterium]
MSTKTQALKKPPRLRASAVNQKLPQPTLEHDAPPRLWHEVDFVAADGRRRTLHFGADSALAGVQLASGYLTKHHPGAVITAARNERIAGRWQGEDV